ncbi:MAG TPA: glycosyltransferase family 4 protein [Acidimicrobiales bacterium]|nr:glycosyltransferase family 4 protein [Acidimicrobiales bacterium]
MSSSLRIGIVAPPWLPVPPRAYGGTEAFIDVLARGLQAEGHEVTLFTTGDATCKVPRRSCFRSAIGIASGTSAHESRHVVEAYEALVGADVIHDHTVVGPLYARSLHGWPVVTTNHGPFDDVLTPVYRALQRRIPVVAISHHQASTARGLTPAAVIHHGLELGRFPVGSGQGGYAAFLGRMHPDKGVDLAIKAARSAGMPLRIAAKMSEPLEKEYFASIIRPMLGADVEFLGEVGFADKTRLLGEAACLLNPIRWAEPFGLVMAEALACGTPVVTTARGSAPEIVEHNKTGFLCRGERSLVHGLERAGELRRADCRSAAEERFSAERMVREYLAVYEKAITPLPESAEISAA